MGSPAPAGIDPIYHGDARDELRFPRTRGDRPKYNARTAWRRYGVRFPRTRGDRPLARGRNGPLEEAGSPAPAGIDPLAFWLSRAGMRFPRTRGDRPTSLLTVKSGHAVPPHPRG